jgi:hypothetical protein
MSATVLKSQVVTIAAQNDAATVLGFPSAGAVAVQIAGTLSATIAFEATVDGTNWVAFNMTPSNSGTAASSASAAGAWSALTLGYAGIRARCSAYTSGSPVVTVRYSS